jgi:MoaA/NifB/PqqE/SkfB family radical SAM enzyme
VDTEVLGFIFTEKCNFRCRHCCNESHPQASLVMDVAEIAQHIQEAAGTGRFKEIGISGGEPFLYPTQLAEIVRLARVCGLTASVTTNGFWGISERRALASLRPLSDEGLTSINISVSSFHLEFTTFRKLRTAARVACDLGLLTRINVVQTSDFTLAHAREAFGELSDRLAFSPMPCIPAGRATAEVAQAELPIKEQPAFGNCRQFFTKVAVTATGDVYPCCSPGGFTPPLRGGNVREASIGSIVRAMESSMLIRVLEGVGPAFFLPFVQERLQRDLVAEGLVDQCHLCHTLLSDEASREVVADALAQLETELSQLKVTLSGLERVTLDG